MGNRNKVRRNVRTLQEIAVKILRRTECLKHSGCVSSENSRLDSKSIFCVCVLNRLIQDDLDHGASKELKNPHPE